MSEPEPIDRLLRHSLPDTPTLSPHFQQRLARRIEPRRVNSKARRFLVGYALVGVALSPGAMVSAGMDWRVAGLWVLVCLVAAGALDGTFFR